MYRRSEYSESEQSKAESEQCSDIEQFADELVSDPEISRESSDYSRRSEERV
jgi:hypothetical protein